MQEYNIYLEDSKYGISIEKYLLNKEVFCVKTVSDVDFGAVLSEYSTILVTGVNCDEVRPDCHFMELYFTDFSGKEKSVKIYIDGSSLTLCAFVKTTLIPINQMFKAWKQY